MSLAVVGIGVDVVHMPRIAHIVNLHRMRFLRRAFHPVEISRYEQLCGPNDKDSEVSIQYLASRWAVKEAVFKAIPGQHRVLFPEIAIVNDPKLPKPRLELFGDAKSIALTRGVSLKESHVSVSHDGEYCNAFVVLQGTIPQ